MVNTRITVSSPYSQKLLLRGSFGQNVDLFGKIVDFYTFYKSVDFFYKIEDFLTKLWLFKQNSGPF